MIKFIIYKYIILYIKEIILKFEKINFNKNEFSQK